jgi:hypothetical protein
MEVIIDWVYGQNTQNFDNQRAVLLIISLVLLRLWGLRSSGIACSILLSTCPVCLRKVDQGRMEYASYSGSLRSMVILTTSTCGRGPVIRMRQKLVEP